MRKLRRIYTAQKMKFSIKDFFSKCDQTRRKLKSLTNKSSFIKNYRIIYSFLNYILFLTWIQCITYALSKIHLLEITVDNFQLLVIVTKGSFLDVAGVHLCNFHLTGMYSKKLTRKTKKLPMVLLHHKLMLTYW